MIFKRTKVRFEDGPLDGQKWRVRGDRRMPEELVVDGFAYRRHAIDLESGGFVMTTTHATYSAESRGRR